MAAILLLATNVSPAQRKSSFSAASQGSVRVKLTVESSVGVVQDADGSQHLIIANAPRTAGRTSVIKRVQLQPSRSSGHAKAQKEAAKPDPHKIHR
ncbi:MAG: hypothetical protein ACM3SW_00735 [Actinomycetota bacterium]